MDCLLIFQVAEEYGNDLYHSIIAENRAKSAEYQKKMGMENRVGGLWGKA